MMDLATLRYVNRQASRRAAANGSVPVLIEADELADYKAGDLTGLSIPYVGDRCPRGYRRVDLSTWFENPYDVHGVYMGDNRGKGAFFVDKSGFGSPSEPALTLRQFFEAIQPGYYYATVEDGPFQVKVGVFTRTK